jgi:hypothetical protein
MAVFKCLEPSYYLISTTISLLWNTQRKSDLIFFGTPSNVSYTLFSGKIQVRGTDLISVVNYKGKLLNLSYRIVTSLSHPGNVQSFILIENRAINCILPNFHLTENNLTKLS